MGNTHPRLPPPLLLTSPLTFSPPPVTTAAPSPLPYYYRSTCRTIARPLTLPQAGTDIRGKIPLRNVSCVSCCGLGGGLAAVGYERRTYRGHYSRWEMEREQKIIRLEPGWSNRENMFRSFLRQIESSGSGGGDADVKIGEWSYIQILDLQNSSRGGAKGRGIALLGKNQTGPADLLHDGYSAPPPRGCVGCLRPVPGSSPAVPSICSVGEAGLYVWNVQQALLEGEEEGEGEGEFHLDPEQVVVRGPSGCVLHSEFKRKDHFDAIVCGYEVILSWNSTALFWEDINTCSTVGRVDLAKRNLTDDASGVSSCCLARNAATDQLLVGVRKERNVKVLSARTGSSISVIYTGEPVQNICYLPDVGLIVVTVEGSRDDTRLWDPRKMTLPLLRSSVHPKFQSLEMTACGSGMCVSSAMVRQPRYSSFGDEGKPKKGECVSWRVSDSQRKITEVARSPSTFLRLASLDPRMNGVEDIQMLPSEAAEEDARIAFCGGLLGRGFGVEISLGWGTSAGKLFVPLWIRLEDSKAIVF